MPIARFESSLAPIASRLAPTVRMQTLFPCGSQPAGDGVNRDNSESEVSPQSREQ
jgi:hypothetical protein